MLATFISMGSVQVMYFKTAITQMEALLHVSTLKSLFLVLSNSFQNDALTRGFSYKTESWGHRHARSKYRSLWMFCQ